mmetsp:Transcript_118553/g.382722  ORF Transcript_118553/g.382722 Transcript_118553/m.382722 type:complete len:898 (+) Transcript_118553:81-2774(+)
MPAELPSREVPYCTVFLVVGAIVSHSLVLSGNLASARMLKELGSSTNGWANVGTSLSAAMQRELDPALTSVASLLTESIGVVSKIEAGIDIVLSTSGATTDAVLLEYNVSKHNATEFKADTMNMLQIYVDKLLGKVQILIDSFIQVITPALNQIKEWMTSFGEKIQSALEEFGTTIDIVQKLFDELMAKISPTAGDNEEDMVFNTYTLIDTDNSGEVDADDLQSLATLYGIAALSGDKAQELFVKYDADGVGGLDVDEYTLFTHDPSIPGIMSVMLRTYAKKLSAVGGRMASARMRDEVASGVVEYLTLVCAKNLTKVAWVSQMLTNGTLPVAFTADVLKDLATDVDNPNKLTLVDVGALVVDHMLRLNKDYVVEALKLMAKPSFWDSEGFDMNEQPAVVARVVRWVAMTPRGRRALHRGVPMIDEAGVVANLPEAAMSVTKERQARYMATRRTGRAQDSASLYSSKASQRLRDKLLGGLGAGEAGSSEDASAAVSSGVHAKPETLLFASWLAANTTSVADGYLHDCFDYSGESSGTLESFANQVNGMIKKVQGFMKLMAKYASPKGIDMLLNEAKGFAKGAAGDIMLIAEGYFEEQRSLAECQLYDNCTATQEADITFDLSGAFSFLTRTLVEIKGILPTVVSNVKFAKKEVAAVSTGMKSIMTVLKGKAPPIFDQVSRLYRALWVAYFVLFGGLTFGILVYGFWASGWLGGPQASAAAEDGYEPPQTFAARCRVCCSACTACMKGCCDSALCFWSVLILMELGVLILFVISVVICIIGGLQAFLSASCSQVYILGDNTICTIALKTVRTFLKTFWSGASIQDAASIPLDVTCEQETLLTCHLIGKQVVSASLKAIIGGLVASVLSLQLVIESAVLHEKATWRRMFHAEAKELKEA